MARWVIHIDMDAFFAAIEQRDNAALRGRPVIIGGCGKRGVVSTASYEARAFGIHSAMPMSQARRLCPHGVFLPPDGRKYAQVSAQIMDILQTFSPLIEPLSQDEAFLDASGMDWLWPSPAALAAAIKARIKQDTGLTASAGVAANKFLAKLASDLKKPDGLVVITPQEAQTVLAPLPVSRLWGIGEKAATALEQHGIRTIGQLQALPLRELAGLCGDHQARELYQLCRGLDDRPVMPPPPPKSLGRETTFAEDIVSRPLLEKYLLALADKVAYRLRRAGVAGRCVTLKVRYAPFDTITRRHTLADPTALAEEIYTAARTLLAPLPQKPVRLLGITVSSLVPAGTSQLSLFNQTDSKKQALAAAIDRLTEKYGAGVITRARLLSRDGDKEPEP